MSHYVLPLDDSAATLPLAGGKGANLSRLARVGFPVPPGFIVTTDAYRAFVRANGLDGRIAELAGAADPADPASFESASDSIRALFAAGAMPRDVADAVTAAYTGAAVAVRSSATAEDLPEASFAGQQDTYLNVRGVVAVREAVQRCWSSLWTARAMAYRARHGIAPEDVSLAVVVQELVPAEAAGILFTVNPVSGARDEIVINAAWGLGEAVVGGEVNPDSLILDKSTGAIKQVVLGDKLVMTAPTAAGTAEVAVDEARRDQPALDAAQAAGLAALGRAIEDYFGSPQDVEWAVAGGQAYILQSRPVTTLVPAAAVPGDDAWPPHGDAPPQPFDLWTQADVGERWPEPVTPLTWSTVPLSVTSNMRHAFRELNAPYLATVSWARRAYGRVYFNEGAMAHVLVHEYGLSGSMVNATLGGQSGETTSERYSETAPGRAAMLGRLPLFGRMMAARMVNESRLPRHYATIERWVAGFEREAATLVSREDAALWAEEAVWMERLTESLNLYSDISGTAMSAVPMFEGLLERWGLRKELAGELFKGLSGLRTAEMVPALWRLARTIEALGLANVVLDNPPFAALAELRARPQARLALEMLDDFLAQHGHRCASEAEWLYPRWSEAPEQVLESLAGYLRAGPGLDPEAAEARQRQARAQAWAEVEAQLGPARRALARGMLARAQHVVRLRDNGQHYIVKLLLPPRRLYAALGTRWTARGWLAAPDDIFFLARDEVGVIVAAGDAVVVGDLAALTAARRRAYEHWLSVPAPEVLDRDGRPVASAAPALDDGAEVLSGFAGSSGRVRGTARLIVHPREAGRLQPGDILVTRSTDPGWTPVFALVSGLVLEVGGQLSHGAIVAREYGIPAVLNVADATRRIRDGQTIEVDGTAGKVYLLPG